MNLALKNWVATAASRSGLLSLLKRGTASSVVFALHRVLPGADSGTAYNRNVSLRVDAFESFLLFVLEQFQVVSLRDFVTQWKQGSARRLATVTFDDGWIDNYEYAFPLLSQYKVPATIFLPTGLTGTTLRLPEERIVRLWNEAESRKQIPAFLDSFSAQSGSPITSLMELRTAFKNFPLAQKLRFLEAEEQRFDIAPAERSFINWDEVRTMQRGGIDFGSHTHGHATLPQESDEAIEQELRTSREDLRRETGEPPSFLAYPNGRFDQRVKRISERTGYEAAFTTHNTFVPECRDLFSVPRVAIDDTVIAGSSSPFNRNRADFYLTMAARATS